MKIKDLKPAGYNPRKITDEKLQMLKKALEEFGDLSGIVFNRQTGNLIGGHQRLKCLPPDAKIEKTKLKKPSRTGTIAEGYIILPSVIPATSGIPQKDAGQASMTNKNVIMEERYSYREVDWPVEKEKAANIAANQQGGEFDDELLSTLVKELSEIPDFDTDLLGFDDNEITTLLNSITKEGQIEDDEVPEVPEKPITKTGDLYILGNHRLLCGDCTIKENIERLMDGKKADMVFTDPPYGMRLDASYKNSDINSKLKIKASKGYENIKGDNQPFCYQKFAWIECKEQFWFGGDYYAKTLPDGGSWLVWDKRHNMTDFDFTMSEFELCWSKQKHAREIIRVQWFGAFGTQTQDVRTRLHPTQKPIQVYLPIIEKYSKNNTLILDPFLGSGSTLIACEKTGRICYGMEIDPHYCDVIVTRYCNFIGNKKITKNGKEIKWPL